MSPSIICRRFVARSILLNVVEAVITAKLPDTLFDK